ncbi:uncharacterized protein [Halyomorpha halys]|uniref:uncharacterized protein isoform X2 n=1 Tax=Halyomorpha halys TaxID=286706 RepID=UPI0006D4FA41|nr:uncharacterized protein LOC106680263 isoform X2 [Halyomorpha halys]
MNLTIVGMEENLNETVEELKAKLDAMKDLLAEEQLKQALHNKRHSNSVHYTARRESIIDGTFLSAVFAVVFMLIVAVSFYAFHNLYVAVIKKYSRVHEEL